MKIFLVQYIVRYYGVNHTDYKYPEFEIITSDSNEARALALGLFYDEVLEMANDYEEDEYYDSDFEILEVREIKELN